MIRRLQMRPTRQALIEVCERCGCACDGRSRARALREAQRTRAARAGVRW